MIAFIVECAVGDYNISRMSFWFISSLLLWANHNEGKLACRLPNLIFFCDFLSVSWHVFCSLVVSRFGTFYVVYFISIVLSTWINGRVVFFLFLLNDSSTRKDVKSSLSFSDDLSILVFL